MSENEKQAINNEPTTTSDAIDDKGPSETLLDDAKTEAGELVPQESGVPGAQKPDNEEIKEEKGPNTE